MDIIYAEKHIRVEKHAQLPDLVYTDSLYLPDWNSYLPKGTGD